MEDLAYDPIIEFYMKMSNSTDNETEVPLFSETMLRLSFKQVFGSIRPLHPKELQLYRKLLLFNFSENYTSITDLVDIMSCFDETQIREYFDKHESIIAKWRLFLKETLLPILVKEALNEILCEYAKRHIALFGEIEEEKLKKKAPEVLKFLRFEDKLHKQWCRVFNSLLQNRLEKGKSENYVDLTAKDLNIRNIFLDVKHRLNKFVIDEVSKHGNNYFKEPVAKKVKTDELNIIQVEVLPSSNLDCVSTDSQDHQYNIDDEIQISNELDSDDEGYEYSSSYYDQQVEAVSQQERPQEILQQVDIVNEDDSEYYGNDNTLSEHEDNDNSENTDCIEFFDNPKLANNETTDTDNAPTQGGIVNKDTALSYLAALQAYVVVNGHFQAIELLDIVDSLLREKK